MGPRLVHTEDHIRFDIDEKRCPGKAGSGSSPGVIRRSAPSQSVQAGHSLGSPQSKGKGVLEPDDRDKEDLQHVRSQPLKEAKTLE